MRIVYLSLPALILTLATTSLAQENPASPVETPVRGVTTATSPPAAIPSSAAPASVSTAPPPAPAVVAPAEEIKPVKGTLKDGTKIEFETDGSVVILNDDGSHVEPPDGILTLKDGTTFNVMGGKKVDE